MKFKLQTGDEQMRKYTFATLCYCLLMVGTSLPSNAAKHCPNAKLLKDNIKHIQKAGNDAKVWIDSRLWEMRSENMKLLQKQGITKIGEPEEERVDTCHYMVT